MIGTGILLQDFLDIMATALSESTAELRYASRQNPVVLCIDNISYPNTEFVITNASVVKNQVVITIEPKF